MQKKLSKLATVRTGFPFRGKIEPSSDGDARVVQIKDLNLDKVIDHSALIRVNWQDGFEKVLLRENDILMPVRGARYPAVLYQELDAPVIAPSHIFIIRCTGDIAPAYLCWLMNQAQIQHRLSRLQTGTTISMLNKAVLEGLDITLPSLEVQHRITQILDKWYEQRRTYEKLIDNGNLLTQALCEEQLNSSK